MVSGRSHRKHHWVLVDVDIDRVARRLSQADLGAIAFHETTRVLVVAYLDGSSNGADNDCDVQLRGMLPLSGDFDAQCVFLIFRQVHTLEIACVNSVKHGLCRLGT